jgi:hypothetical protein
MVNRAFEMKLFPEGRFDVLNTRMGPFPRGMTIAIRRIVTACTCKHLACKDISALNPAILTGNNLRGDAVLIWTIRMGAMDKKGANDTCVTVCSSEVKWGCTRSTNNRSGRVTAAIRVPAGKSWCIDICSVFDEKIDYKIIATCTSSM